MLITESLRFIKDDLPLSSHCVLCVPYCICSQTPVCMEVFRKVCYDLESFSSRDDMVCGHAVCLCAIHAWDPTTLFWSESHACTLRRLSVVEPTCTLSVRCKSYSQIVNWSHHFTSVQIFELTVKMSKQGQALSRPTGRQRQTERERSDIFCWLKIWPKKSASWHSIAISLT